MAEPFDVFIVDASRNGRAQLANLVRAAGMNVDLFAEPKSFLARLANKTPGCVLLNFKLPGISGPELHDHLLGRGVSIPVVFLIDYDDFPASLREMKNRDADFLSKPVQAEALRQSLQAARDRAGDIQAPDDEQHAVLSQWQRLTPRERQVLEHVLGGFLNKQTAFRLGIAEKTVKIHRQRVMAKMDARSVAQLVRQCEMAGIRPRQVR